MCSFLSELGYNSFYGIPTYCNIDSMFTMVILCIFLGGSYFFLKFQRISDVQKSSTGWDRLGLKMDQVSKQNAIKIFFKYGALHTQTSMYLKLGTP